jgi:hypothetical protein
MLGLLGIDKDEILVIDNLFEKSITDKIFKEFKSDTFNWFLSEGSYTVTEKLYDELKDENTFEYYQLSHNFITEDGKKNSIKFDLIVNIVEILQKHFKCQFYFNKIKANLQTKFDTELLYNTPHQDQKDRDHIVVIYYVNDSDGKTFIFENNFSPWKIKKTIESKKGRIVMFDGKYFHSGSHPKNEIRFVINFNIVGVENFL